MLRPPSMSDSRQELSSLAELSETTPNQSEISVAAALPRTSSSSTSRWIARTVLAGSWRLAQTLARGTVHAAGAVLRPLVRSTPSHEVEEDEDDCDHSHSEANVIHRNRLQQDTPLVHTSSELQDYDLVAGVNTSSTTPVLSSQQARRKAVNAKLMSATSHMSLVAPHPLRVHIATWNVAQQPPPADSSAIKRWVLGDALVAELEAAASQPSIVPLTSFPDVVVVGLQEVEFGGVALMVETTESSVAWMEAVTDCLNNAVGWRVRFKKLRTVQLVGIVLIVIVRANHEPFVNHLRTSLSRTGAVGGVLGNKGSIGLRMTLYGKRFLFICAHFHPHLNNEATRMKNYHNALAELKFQLPIDADDMFDIYRSFDEALRAFDPQQVQRRGGSLTRQDHTTQGQSAWSRFFSLRAKSGEAVWKEIKVLETHDYVFFFGDLNYRIHGFRGEPLRRQFEQPSRTDSASERGVEQSYATLIQNHDELRLGMQRQKIFNGFEEADISFPPTYKYDIGTDTFDSSKKRRDPAWTDRVLFRVWDDQHPLADLRKSSLTSFPRTSSVSLPDAEDCKKKVCLSELLAAKHMELSRSPSGRSLSGCEESSSPPPRVFAGEADPPTSVAEDSRQVSPLIALVPAVVDEVDDTPPCCSEATTPVKPQSLPSPPPFSVSAAAAKQHQRSASLTSFTSASTHCGGAFAEFVPNRLTLSVYDSVPSLRLSDHKPVLALFEVDVVGATVEQVQQAMVSCRDLWDSEHCEVDAYL